MLYYRITYFFLGGQQYSVGPGPEDIPEGMDAQGMPEDEWVDRRGFEGRGAYVRHGDRGEPFRDPHGFLERFAATEVGALLEGRLGWPIGVRCEVEEAVA